MGTAKSHVVDDGKTRVVAVIERGRAVIHATKYGSASTTLVTASMSEADAHALGVWLTENARP
jgi:hypothetical protein